MLPIREDDKGFLLKIYVQPRSRKNEVVGLHDDALKIKITSPPVDGAANRACINFLAKCLKLPKSCIDIVSGHTSRIKQIRVSWPNSHDAATSKKELAAAIQSLFQPRRCINNTTNNS
jgi:hypothetical protein